MTASIKTIEKNIIIGIKKENLLVTDHSYFMPALEQTKHVARIFSIYFKNNIL